MSTTLHAPTNQDLALQALDALETAGITADDAARIVSRMYPAGHDELARLLRDDPDAIGWLPHIWAETFADRFRCTTAAAAAIQRLLREAVTA